MPNRHVALTLLVIVLWGLNFLAIDATLQVFPPIFSAGFRFLLMAIPVLLFVPRPNVKWRWLLGYGLGFGTFQFLFLYLGMAAGYPTGLASLVLQSSGPFTVLLGALLLRERITPLRLVFLAMAVCGLVVVGLGRGLDSPILPFLLVVAGGFSWALGNLASRQAGTDQPLAFMFWMTIVPPIPLMGLSLLVEGPQEIGTALQQSLSTAALPGWLGLGYTIVLGTIVGSGIWIWLMSRHPAGLVAPYSMLVPVVGITAAWLVLGERPNLVELIGAGIVIVGVLAAGAVARRVSAAEAAGMPAAEPGDAVPAR